MITLEQIEAYEDLYRTNDYLGDKSKPRFSFYDGEGKVLISAPHSVKSYRMKNDAAYIRNQDDYTGSYSMILHDILGYPTVIRNSSPSYIPEAIEFEEICDYIRSNDIRFLLDVHGCFKRRPFDIAPGTNHGLYIHDNRDYEDLLVSSFNSVGINQIDFDSKFQAATDKSVCKHVFENCDIDTMQLEMNARYRRPKEEIESSKRILQGLSIYLRQINHYVSFEKECQRLKLDRR